MHTEDNIKSWVEDDSLFSPITEQVEATDWYWNSWSEDSNFRIYRLSNGDYANVLVSRVYPDEALPFKGRDSWGWDCEGYSQSDAENAYNGYKSICGLIDLSCPFPEGRKYVNKGNAERFADKFAIDYLFNHSAVSARVEVIG